MRHEAERLRRLGLVGPHAAMTAIIANKAKVFRNFISSSVHRER